MRRVARAVPTLVAILAAAPLSAQVSGTRPVSDGRVMTQTISVPVFPGQMVSATLSLPTLEETPLPAVLLLARREPGAAAAPAALALTEALLARGMAVVRLDIAPPAADAAAGGEPLDQPADDAYAVLQFVREREDIDGDRVGIVGLGAAAEHAGRAASLDEAAGALVLLGTETIVRDTLGLPTDLPVLLLPLEVRAAPTGSTFATPVSDAAVFLSRHLQ